MTGPQTLLASVGVLCSGAALVLPFALVDGESICVTAFPLALIFALVGLATALRFKLSISRWLDLVISVLGAIAVTVTLSGLSRASTGYWLLLIAAWAFAWLAIERITREKIESRTVRRLATLFVPLYFGAWILIVWEAVTRGAHIPSVLLPPPSAIWQRMVASVPILFADFQQTFLKAVLVGYAIGNGSAFLTAIAIDRSPFLQRGLLPLGNFISALPIIGIAPIMVMWFGFDWQSKAAVVIVMTFFPMLVNTLTGLAAAGSMEHDLMRTYAAGYWQALIKLRLPSAAPFIFNALKINSTLALIGAIVAEFFGTPLVGMGFRISTEVGRMNIDMVWAEIAVAAFAGTAFYGVVTLVERAVTFWHPSLRSE